MKANLIAKVRAIIKRHKIFLISTHVSPDPDGLASEIAFGLYLKKQGKKIHIVNADEVPRMYRFLPGVHLIQKFESIPLMYDVAIILDCGNLNRLGSVKKLITSHKPILNIDHHIASDRFGMINLVVPSASSTAEVIFDYIQETNGVITKPIAQLLYLGIMTDTGSFRYDNTTSHTLGVASELLKFGFSVSEMYRRVYENMLLSDIRVFTKIINNFEITHRGKVVTVELTKNILNRCSGQFDLRDKIFTFFRAIKGVEVLVILTEHERHSTRVNFRSQGKIDVARLASLYQGGGHKRASGCWVDLGIRETKNKIHKELNRVIR